MFRQHIGITERFVAVLVRALEVFRFLVDVFDVNPELRLVVEHFFARAALVRRLLLVDASYMRTSIRTRRKRLFTPGARERHYG